jgi:hypothetical protein
MLRRARFAVAGAALIGLTAGAAPPFSVTLHGSELTMKPDGQVLVEFATQPDRRGSVTLQRVAGGAHAAQSPGHPRRMARRSFHASSAGEVSLHLTISVAGRKAVRRAGATDGLPAEFLVRVGTHEHRQPVRIRPARR